MEKRVFHPIKRSYLLCEEFECIYAHDEECRVPDVMKKDSIPECPNKGCACAKAYCTHCAKFMTEVCPREKKKPNAPTKIVEKTITTK